MESRLAKALIKSGVIRQGTVLEAYRSARGLSCITDSYALTSYKVLGASVSGEHVYFDVASSPSDRCRIRSDYVMSVDGMAIKRVAAAHQLREDGSTLPGPYKPPCD